MYHYLFSSEILSLVGILVGTVKFQYTSIFLIDSVEYYQNNLIFYPTPVLSIHFWPAFSYNIIRLTYTGLPYFQPAVVRLKIRYKLPSRRYRKVHVHFSTLVRSSGVPLLLESSLMNDPILFGSLSWADVTTIRILRQIELTESRRVFRQPSCTLTVSRISFLLLLGIL